MKKLLSMLGFVLMLTCVGFAFTSCGGDDDDFDPNNPIVGTWLTEEEMGVYGMATFKNNGEWVIGVHFPDNLMKDEFFKQSYEKAHPQIEGTYSVSGDKVNVIVTKCEVAGMDIAKMVKVISQTMKYSISKDNKRLTLTYKDFYTGQNVTEKYTRK